MNHVQNIPNIRHCATLAQRANGESVTTVAIAVTEVDFLRWAADRQAIIPIEDDVVLE